MVGIRIRVKEKAPVEDALDDGLCAKKVDRGRYDDAIASPYRIQEKGHVILVGARVAHDAPVAPVAGFHMQFGKPYEVKARLTRNMPVDLFDEELTIAKPPLGCDKAEYGLWLGLRCRQVKAHGFSLPPLYQIPVTAPNSIVSLMQPFDIFSVRPRTGLQKYLLTFLKNLVDRHSKQ
jgi:hypothetical protein